MLGMIFMATVAMAATPDFSGTWARDSANSDPIPNQMYWLTREAPAAPEPLRAVAPVEEVFLEPRLGAPVRAVAGSALPR